MKKLLIGLLVLVGLAVTTLVAAPSFIDWNARKAWIAGPLSDALGGPVSIDGNVDLRLLPTPVFSAAGVRFAGPGPTAEDDRLTIDSLDVRVALLPLLSGSIEVERLVLIRPRLVLEVQEDGDVDWRPGNLGEGWAEAIVPRQVTIEDGTLVLRDVATGDVQRLQDVDARLSAESLVGPAELESNFVWRDQAIAVDLTTRRPTAGGAVPVTLSLAHVEEGIRLRYGGLVGADRTAQGEISLEGPDVLSLARPAFPEQESPAGALPFSLTAGLRATPQRIELSVQSLDVGGTSGRGSITAVPGDRTSVTVDLAFGRIALDDWLAAGATASVLHGWWTGSQAHPALPQGLDLAVDLTAEAVDFRGEVIRQARLQALAGEAHVAISRLTARLPLGSDMALAGDVRLDGDLPTVDVSGELSSSDLRALLEWLGADVAAVPSDRLRAFAGTASLIGTADDFQLTGVDIALDQTRLRGGLAFLNRGRPGIGVRISIDRLNLDHYLPIAGFTDIGDAALSAALADAAERFDANIEARIDNLTLSGVAVDDAHLDATINDGSITVRDASLSAFDGAMVQLSGTLDGLGTDAGFDITTSVAAPALAPVLRDLELSVPISPQRFGAVSVDSRLSGTLEDLLIDLTGTAAGGQISLTGRLADLADAANYDLAVRLSHPDTVDLLDLLDAGYRPRGPLGAVDLYTRLHGTEEDLRLADLQGTVGAVSVGGQVRLRLVDDRPDITLDLRTSALTLDDLLPANGPPHRWRAARLSPWSHEPIDTAWLTTFDGALALTATALTAGRYRFDNPALRLNLRDGTLTLPGMSGTLFGGAFGMSGEAQAGDALHLNGSISLVGADLGEALAAAFDMEAGDGVLNFRLAGDAAGSTQAELIASLSGEGLIAVRDGVAHGLDLVAATGSLATLESALDVLPTLRPAFSAGSTPFAAINAPFAMEAGIVRTRSLRFMAPSGVAEGQGTVDLPQWQIDVATELTLTGLPGAPPIGVRWIGPVDAPAQRLRTAALADYIARGEAERADAATPREEPLRAEPGTGPDVRQHTRPGRSPREAP